MSYLKQHQTLGARVTPQRERARSDQAKNAAGGYVFTIDPFQQLRRFLILGTEGGSYYASEQKLTRDNLKVVMACLKLDGIRVVETICEVSSEGLAAKQDATLYALAAAASTAVPTDEAGASGVEVRRFALAQLPSVCRTGTMLFQFVDYAQTLRGWGRAMRKAIGRWYAEQSPGALASQVVKYRQRGGWSHADLLRKAHPGDGFRFAEDAPATALYDWIVNPRRKNPVAVNEDALPDLVHGFELAQKAEIADGAADLITRYGLPREAIPTDLLNHPETWTALLHAGEHGMPMTAMIRNLATMTRHGVIKPMRGGQTDFVTSRLTDQDAIQRARIHPYNVLTALYTYRSGRGARGSNSWDPVTEITSALDKAFYLAFKNVVPANKRTMVALDCSGSMHQHLISQHVPGLTAAVGAAAMALVTLATEPKTMTVAFASKAFGAYGGRNSGKMPDGHWTPTNYEAPGQWGYHQDALGIVPVPLAADMRLDAAVDLIAQIPMGGTDCALPMIYATEKELEVDTYLLFTDNETWAGGIHPFQALKAYREKSGIDAKLVVVAMTPSPFSIADPSDPGMVDVIGFDSSAPSVIAAFSRGDI